MITEKSKEEHGAIAVFGKGWGGELRLPKGTGTGSYILDSFCLLRNAFYRPCPRIRSFRGMGGLLVAQLI